MASFTFVVVFILCAASTIDAQNVINVINIFNDSVDLEWSYDDATSFQIRAIRTPPPHPPPVNITNTNKATVMVTPVGLYIFTVIKQSTDGCPSIAEVSLGTTANANVQADLPVRESISNFDVKFGTDAMGTTPMYNASWDAVPDADFYIITSRRQEDCDPNESSYLTSNSHNMAMLKHSDDNVNMTDLMSSSFIFNVRVYNYTMGSNKTIRPKADELAKALTDGSPRLNEIRLVKATNESIEIEWDSLNGISTYTLVYKEMDGEPKTMDVNGNTAALMNLKSNTEYWMWVNPGFNAFFLGSAKLTAKTDITRFDIKLDTRMDTSIYISWPAVVNATSYLVAYGIDSTQMTSMNMSRITPNATLSNLMFDTEYRIVVTVEGSSDESNIYKVRTAKPLNYDLSKPCESSSRFQVVWAAAGVKKVTVSYYVVPDGNASNPMTKTIQNMEYITGLIPNTTYSVHVSIYDRDPTSMYAISEPLINTTTTATDNKPCAGNLFFPSIMLILVTILSQFLV